MINIDAAILPWEGIGGIKLYSHIKNLKNVIISEKATSFLYDRFLVRYEIQDTLYLFFNIINGKLFKITALKDYRGKTVNGICIGQKITDALLLDNSFEYDDFEEVYVSPNGIFIETDPLTERIQWISVFVKELETEIFDDAMW